MNLKPYPKYKDSGIEWLGEVPEGWEKMPIKFLVKPKKFAIKTGPFGSDLKREDFTEQGIKIYNQQNVINNDFCLGDNYINQAKYETLISFTTYAGDILITSRGTIGKCAILPENCDKGILHPCLIRVQVDEAKCYKKFLAYIIQDSNYFYDQLLILSNATTIDVIYGDNLSNAVVLLPSINEQISITNFLDQKTTKIDELIKKNEKLVEILKEKRQAIISHAVTKGLDPNAKMKDSGIEWIGKIPEGWEVKKIKYTSYIKGRVGWHGLRSDEFTDEGTYLVTGTDFIGDKVNWGTCYHISDERYNQDPYIQLRENDLLITKDGTIGKVALVKNLPDRATLNSGIMLIRPITTDYCTDFMFWILNSKVFSEYNEHTKTGSTIQHLYQETFENFIFSAPHIDEQKNICVYLTQKTAHVDKTIQNILSQIKKLKEYRQALISNVVTGKVRVL